MASVPQVCGLLLLPERNDALAAVGRFVLLIRRRYALSAKEIASSLKKEDGKAPSSDTIERAEAGKHMLGFDLIAQLAYLYPDAADPIHNLLSPAPTAEPTTLEERLQRAENEILAVRRELASGEGK
jgi:hypothetical protein